METLLEESIYLQPYVNSTIIESNIRHSQNHREKQADDSSWTDEEIQEDRIIIPKSNTFSNTTVIQTPTNTSKKSDGNRLLSIAKRLEREERINQNKLLKLRKHLIEALTLVEKELQGQQPKKRRRWQKFILCK